MYRFPFIRDGNFLIDAEKEAVFHEWLLKTPFVFISQSNEWGKLLSGSTQITAALGIFEEQLSFFDLDMKFATYYPSCSCLYSIVQEQGESFQPLDCLSSLMDFVKGNGIKVTDDPVSADAGSIIMRCLSVQRQCHKRGETEDGIIIK